MHSRTHISSGARLRSSDRHSFNIPIECIRKTRALNIDNRMSVSREIYKILKSRNGRKIFT